MISVLTHNVCCALESHPSMLRCPVAESSWELFRSLLSVYSLESMSASSNPEERLPLRHSSTPLDFPRLHTPFPVPIGLLHRCPTLRSCINWSDSDGRDTYPWSWSGWPPQPWLLRPCIAGLIVRHYTLSSLFGSDTCGICACGSCSHLASPHTVPSLGSHLLPPST